MAKTIGITCDKYKVNSFRKGLLKAGFVLKYDGESGVGNSHLFTIEVREEDFKAEQEKIGKLLKKLNLEAKHSN